MKKLIALLFSLAFANNSFGMLTSKKNLRSFCTKTSSYDKKNSSDHPLIFKENELNLSTQDNKTLLREIIAQNKENNLLLRAILQQNYLLSHRTYNNWDSPDYQKTKQLNDLQDHLTKEYNIKIKPNE